MLEDLLNYNFDNHEDLKIQKKDLDEFKNQREKERQDFIDNFCAWENIDENTARINIKGTFDKIAEEIWKLNQKIKSKADKEIRLR